MCWLLFRLSSELRCGFTRKSDEMGALRAQVELEDFDAVKVWQFSMKPKTAQGVSVFEPLRALRKHEYTEVSVQ